MLSYSLTCLMLARSSSVAARLQRAPPPQLDREPYADRVCQLGEDCGRTKRGDFLKLKTVQLWGSGQTPYPPFDRCPPNRASSRLEIVEERAAFVLSPYAEERRDVHRRGSEERIRQRGVSLPARCRELAHRPRHLRSRDLLLVDDEDAGVRRGPGPRAVGRPEVRRYRRGGRRRGERPNESKLRGLRRATSRPKLRLGVERRGASGIPAFRVAKPRRR